MILAKASIIGVVVSMLLLAAPAYSAPGTGTLFGTSGNLGELLAIDQNTGAGTAVGAMGAGVVPSLAVDPTTDIMYAGGGGGNASLYTVDPASGAATLVGGTGQFGAVGGLDFREDGTLFAAMNIVGDGGTGSDNLATIDPATGTATVIGPFGTCDLGTCTIEQMEGIAFDSSGTLWASQSSDRGAQIPGLYTINTSTGAATFVAEIRDGSGTVPSGGVVSLQFDCDGTLFGGTARAVAPATDGGRLITINPATGVFSFVGSTAATAGSSLAALAFGDSCGPRSISLAPTFARNLTGTDHTVTATVQPPDSAPLPNVAVQFTVRGGPNQGTTGADTTDANGEATFTYTSNAPGIDSIVAEFTDTLGRRQTSNTVRKQWVSPSATEVCNGLDDNGDGNVDEGFPNSDGDATADCVDQDEDSDGIPDGTDNCPQDPNAGQGDSNGNGIGDACDPGNPPIVNPPSAVEIDTDGQFEPPTGEWADITPASFLGGDSLVYSAVEGQDIYLMYDYRLNTAPLSSGGTVGPISFQVGLGSFFDVFVKQGGPNTDFGPNPATSAGGTGDTVEVLVNGEPFDNSAGCVGGAVDHNSTSPNFAGAHNLVELEVRLRGFGGCYSPEPAFWSATLPSVAPSGPAAAAAPAGTTVPQNVQTSAAFFKVEPDGTTEVTALELVPPNAEPDCSGVHPDPATLWPPNHKFRRISLAGATDPDADDVTLTVTDVTQDEAGSQDARLAPASHRVDLRAERDGKGDGRVYRVSFAASDGKGGSCSGTVKVGVPKNQGKKGSPIDSAPPSFNSL